MSTLSQLWASAERLVGSPIGRQEQAFIRGMGWLDYLGNEDADDFQSSVREVAKAVKALREAGLSRKTGPTVAISPADSRWKLLADLHQLAHPEAPSQPPLSITAVHAVGFAMGAPDEGQMVEIRMDFRLGLGNLMSALRRLWPLLQREGLVRRSRPLSDRNLALLRHICIDRPPGTNWRDLLSSWNAICSPRPAWRFNDTRAMQTALHRSERELTGKRHGLRWYYNPLARLSAEDLTYESETGNAAARREENRRYQDGVTSVREAGIEFQTVEVKKGSKPDGK